MSVVINSYQTGRPSNVVDVATAITHLRIFASRYSRSMWSRVQTASLARPRDDRITSVGTHQDQDQDQDQILTLLLILPDASQGSLLQRAWSAGRETPASRACTPPPE